MAKTRFSVWRQLAVGLFMVMTVIAFSLIWIFELALQPQRDMQAKAEAVAKSHTDLEEVSQFALFTRDGKSYYSLQGQAADGENLAVLVPEKGGSIYTYNLDKGLGADQAAAVARKNGAGKVKKTTLGLLGKKPVWEVYAGRTYYYIGFESGELISKEGL